MASKVFISSNTYISDKIHITIRNCKNLSCIICFNYNKNNYYTIIYTKFTKNSNNLNN